MVMPCVRLSARETALRDSAWKVAPRTCSPRTYSPENLFAENLFAGVSPTLFYLEPNGSMSYVLALSLFDLAYELLSSIPAQKSQHKILRSTYLTNLVLLSPAHTNHS